MQVYVEEMYDTCLEFLKSIPGQEETSKWFEQRMKNPEALQNCDQHLKTLLHGDLWHNNIYFHDRHSIYIRTVSSSSDTELHAGAATHCSFLPVWSGAMHQ
jgi:fructosamine-3-kinase